MNRLSTCVTLIVLAGIGWACAFGVIGLGLYAGATGMGPVLAVFGSFGFLAGAACTVMRLAFEQQLPMDLAASLRRAPDASPAEPAPTAVSAFGA